MPQAMDFGGDTDVPIVCQCNLHACESLRDQRVSSTISSDKEREREKRLEKGIEKWGLTYASNDYS